jgi:hypothetical protein
MTVNLRSSLNTGLNNGLRQSISGGVNGLGFFRTASLDLQFASKKTLNDRVSSSNLITFTRASSATYVGSDGLIKTAAVNEPRFDHDPVTGESLGLLKEEASTNLLTYSEEFDQSAWQKSNTTVTSNAIAAPDGTTTADLVLDNTVNASHSIGDDSPTLSSGIDYTFSVYAKAQDLDHCFLLLYSGGGAFPIAVASYDLTNLTAASAAGTPAFSIKDAENGWRRLSITETTTSAATTRAEVRLSQDGVWANRNYLGSGQGIYLWGAQLEAGSVPTSYIQTTSSAVTRAADVAEITGTNFSSFYNQSEGAVFVEAKASGTSAVVGFDDGTTAERWRVGYAGSNNSSIVVVDGGVVQTNINTSSNSTPYNQFHKLAGAIAANNLSFAFNGTLTSDSSLSVPVVNALNLGTSIGVGGYLNGHIKRLAYFPTRLPDATLQNITT